MIMIQFPNPTLPAKKTVDQPCLTTSRTSPSWLALVGEMSMPLDGDEPHQTLFRA